MRAITPTVSLLFLLVFACEQTPSEDAGADTSRSHDTGADAEVTHDADMDSDADGSDADQNDEHDAEPDADPDVDQHAGPPPQIVVGTWNLHNFSVYGPREYRIDDIAEMIESLDVDILGVQEIKLEDGTTSASQQAYDVLLEQLEDYDGILNPWSQNDTTVGLLYREDRVTVIGHQTLFENEWRPFPRPPLEARLRIERDGRAVQINVIVLHLKAFAEDVERRRAACERLDGYLQSRPDLRYIVLGDFNDDPHDEPSHNAFIGTFLENEPAYYFVTASLPAVSVTSIGYYHFVDGQRVMGEFLDHFVVTGELYDEFSTWTPRIETVPESEYATFEANLSDHFPVILTAEP